MNPRMTRSYADEGLLIACLVQVKTDREKGVNPAKMTASGYSKTVGGSVSRIIAMVDAWDYTAGLLNLPTSSELGPADYSTRLGLLTNDVRSVYDDTYRMTLAEWKLPHSERTVQTVDRSRARGPQRRAGRSETPTPIPMIIDNSLDGIINEMWPMTAARNHPTMLNYALSKTRSDRAQICTLRLAIRSALRVLDDPNSHDRSVEDRMHSARSILLGELDDIKGREQEERASATDHGDREYQRALRKINQ